MTLSAASASTVAVQYATANVTATAGTDYTATAGTLTFNPGVTALSIAIPVIGDTASEATETFVVNLSSPTNGVLGDAQGVGTIVNDDSGATTAVTFQIGAGADDVNEDGGAFAADGTEVWVGSAATPATAVTGLRFTNVTIPQGAAITSARLELQSVSPQWLTTVFELGMEAAANSAVFSPASRPSQRPLLAPRVAHASDTQWLADTWYQLDELAPLLQAVVNQPAWAPGNALAVVVRGGGQAWARKFAHAYESDPTRAPRLVVTYAGQGPPPTPSLSINDVTLGGGAVRIPAGHLHRVVVLGQCTDRHRELRHRQRHGHRRQRLHRDVRHPDLHAGSDHAHGVGHGAGGHGDRAHRDVHRRPHRAGQRHHR